MTPKLKTILRISVEVVILIGLSVYLLEEKPKPLNQANLQKVEAACRSLDNFTFAVTSDNHTAPNGLSDTFAKILKKIENKNYLFVADTGDMVSDGAVGTYQIFFDAIINLKSPFLVVMGNHDAQGQGRQTFENVFGPAYYSFDCKNSLFIFLDDSNTLGLSSSQKIWLESQLKKEAKHKFVFMHIPPFDPRQNQNHSLANSSKASSLENLLAKYKPDLVFTGHIHAYYDVFKKGIEYVIDGGGGGGNYVGNDPQHDFHNYLEIKVQGDTVTKEVIKIK